MSLNAEQQIVFDAVKERRSVLMTGAGGVGKSYIIGTIVAWAEAIGLSIGVTAMTGCAAILINGSTLHSFLGIGLATKTVPQLVQATLRNKKTFHKLRSLQLLIIDEVSMINEELFDLISEYLSEITTNPAPFGGIQLILSGDLYQIHPIRGQFFFKSKTWDRLNPLVLDLKKSQRHLKDDAFSALLQKLRLGKCDSEMLQILKQTEANLAKFPANIKPTIMYTKNVDVDTINQQEIDKLVASGAHHMTYPLVSPSAAALRWATSCKIPESIQLAIGCQVMLVWNVSLSENLCNGSRGVIIELDKSGVTVNFLTAGIRKIEYISVEKDEKIDGKKVTIRFMPLRLAYAITVNKAQGMTMDAAVVDMNVGSCSPEFIYGKFYTAISRVRDLNSIVVKNPHKSLFKAHPDVAAFYASSTSNAP